jgi:hypothetical protein
MLAECFGSRNAAKEILKSLSDNLVTKPTLHIASSCHAKTTSKLCIAGKTLKCLRNLLNIGWSHENAGFLVAHHIGD